MAHNKVVTNPRTRFTPRKVKDLMTHEETQGVARSPSCCRRLKVNLRESRLESKSPVAQPRPHHSPQITGKPQTHSERDPANPSSRAGTRTSRSRKTTTNQGPAQAEQRLQDTTKQSSHRSRSLLNRSAKDGGTMARIANPWSENEGSDRDDQDYTVVGDGGEVPDASEADTLVPEAVQHVHQTGYPST